MGLNLTLLPSEDTPLGKALVSFGRWWLSGLQKALPLNLLEKRQPRQSFFSDRQTISILNDTGESQLTENYSESMSADMRQALQDAKNKQFVLLLDESMLLQKQLTFPRMSDADLQNALKYHLSSATPFQPDQLYFDYIYTPTDEGVSVQLIAVPRHVVQASLDFISESGQSVERMATRKFPDINLLPHERKQSMASATRWRIAAAIVLLFLVVAIVLTPLIQKRAQLILLDAELATVKQLAKPLIDKKNVVLKQYSAAKRLLDMHAANKAELRILNQLSDLIPDSAWLMELRVDGTKIKIRGESDEAIGLLETLQNSKLFTDVHFLSPVSTNRKTGRDSFYIEALVVGGHK